MKNALAYYYAGVVLVNSRAVGLATDQYIVYKRSDEWLPVGGKVLARFSRDVMDIHDGVSDSELFGTEPRKEINGFRLK
jgi:hypothetical protein